jgi:predicted Zn-ribbon and HTH transcriptional regulator
MHSIYPPIDYTDIQFLNQYGYNAALYTIREKQKYIQSLTEFLEDNPYKRQNQYKKVEQYLTTHLENIKKNENVFVVKIYCDSDSNTYLMPINEARIEFLIEEQYRQQEQTAYKQQNKEYNAYIIEDLTKKKLQKEVQLLSLSMFKQAKCPNCGATLDINPEKDIIICPYCNSSYNTQTQ